jgi:hypothetical protein
VEEMVALCIPDEDEQEFSAPRVPEEEEEEVPPRKRRKTMLAVY